MRTLLLCTFALTILASLNSCHKCKDKDLSNNNVDSIQIHQTGGIAGFNDHYVITNAAVRKDIGDDDIYTFEQQLSSQKHDEVKGMLTAVPKDVLTNNIEPVHIQTADYLHQWIVTFKNEKAYTFHYDHQGSKAVQDYFNRVNNTLTVLKQ